MSRKPVLAALLLAVTALPAASVATAEAAGGPVLQAPSSIQRWEDDGDAIIRVSLSKKAKRPVTVSYKTVDGSAKAGTDYEKRSGKVTIKKGRTAAKVAIGLIDDHSVEPTETFKVKLSSPDTKPSKKTVTVTITDDDQTARNLSGTITVDYQVRQTGDYDRGQDVTFTMNLNLVPTVPGLEGAEWRDDGTGTWTLSGSAYDTSTYSDDACQYSSTTDWEDTGTFYPDVHSGSPDTGKSDLTLFFYHPATKAETPVLDWRAAAAGERTSYHTDIDTGACVSEVSAYGILYRLIWPDQLAGAPASYTGLDLGTRGLSFDYSFTRETDVPGGVSTETATVTGDLHPVG
jgi:hypothetical protein